MKLSFLGLFIFAALSINSINYLACSQRDTVNDYLGFIVKDKNGSCIRTMWIAKSDSCEKYRKKYAKT